MVQRLAQHATRIVIAVAFLALLGICGAIETAGL
jgi:hypothetical protein